MSPIPSIWSIRPDGSGRHRILQTNQNAKRARLSPDGTWVAFDGSPPGVAAMSDFDIQLVRLDGTGLRRVTRGPAWDVDAQWSPDGKWLAFSRLPPHASDEHRASIWVVRPNGTGLRRVAAGFGARWSPDGRQLAYEAPRGAGVSDLSVIGVDGKRSRSLVTTAGIEQPAGWHGTKVLFTRYAAGGGAGVFVVDADGGHYAGSAPGSPARGRPTGGRSSTAVPTGRGCWSCRPTEPAGARSYAGTRRSRIGGNRRDGTESARTA